MNDLTNQVFSYLTAIEPLDKRDNRKVIWKCRCICGKECEVISTNLTSGRTKSCGCKQKELISEMRTKDNPKVGDIFRGYKILQTEIRKDSRGYNTWWVQIECPYCEEHKKFWCEATRLGANTGVKSCGCLKVSSGELRIEALLVEAGIPFEREKTFEGCYLNKKYARSRFDFYVNNQYLIEFDGIQHSKITGWATEENLKKTQERDAYKNQWCKETNIPLIRIPYTRYKDLCIEDLMLETTTFLYKGETEYGDGTNSFRNNKKSV